jgi:hypothetical protein
MNLEEARQIIDSLETHPDASRVFGQPYETTDGATVIPVVNMRVASKRGGGNGPFALRAKPAGVYVIKDGRPTWAPAIDGEKIALMGILVGLVSATLAGLAMVRRPPWPDLYGDISYRR